MVEKISKSLMVLCAVFIMMFIPNVKAATASVTTDMTNKEIQSIVDSNDTIEFATGEYQNLSLTVDGNKTFKMTGKVTFTSDNGNNFGILFKDNTKSNLTIDGDLTISSYREGIFVSNDCDVTLDLVNNSKLSLINSLETEQNHGSGMWIGYRSIFNLNGTNGSSFIASDNTMAGINVMGSAKVTLNFNDMALVDMSNNSKVSGYHAGMESGSTNILNFTNVNKVTMNNNGVDAVCVSGDNDQINITGSNVSMTNNHSWGTNGGNIKVINSYLNISNNSDGPWANVKYTASNMYANNLTVKNSTIDANNCGANSGIWVENTAEIIGSTINVNNNGQEAYGNYNYSQTRPYYQGDYPWNMGNGIAFCGKTSITSSTINANNNGGAGIAFYGEKSDTITEVLVNLSILNANNNGVSKNFTVEGDKIKNDNSLKDRSGFTVALYSGIAVFNAEVKVTDSSFTLLDNKRHGIGYHEAYAGKFIVDGYTIGKIATTDNVIQKEIEGFNSNQQTIILSGSVEANHENMTGDFGNYNDQKKEDEKYTGPINNDSTKLVDFELNKNNNKEMKEDKNSFTYYDPNNSTKYDYVFRYDDQGKAYVWTPVSILRYDATEGFISSLGTAGILNVGFSKTLQDNLLKAGLYSRFTQDVTIYGNNMNLAEKLLAVATRDGYVFKGWYIASDSELAKKYALEGNFEELYKLLNTKFDETTKLMIDGKPVSELTVYAKWDIEEKGMTRVDDITPPNTLVDSNNNIELLIASLITIVSLVSVSKLIVVRNSEI